MCPPVSCRMKEALRATKFWLLQPGLSDSALLDTSLYDSAINEFLSWFDAALAPDIFKLPQIWMLVVATLIWDGSN